MSNPVENLTHSKLLAKNTIYNLLGQTLPLIAALFSVPIFIKYLGTDKFGLFSIALMVLGYFGLFDLGLGRVVTKMVGEKLGTNKEDQVAAVIFTGLIFMLILGCLAGGIVLLIAKPLAYSWLKIPTDLLTQAYHSFIILSICVPLVTITSGLRGVLEAYQRFDLVNIVRVSNGTLLFLSPLVIIPFTLQMPWYIIGLLIVRCFVCCAYFLLCWKFVPAMSNAHFDKTLIKPMFSQGGWMSISNIVGAVLIYFDRFFIGMWISLAAVSFYVTPYEVVSKIMLVTGAFVRVLFPAFSASHAAKSTNIEQLYSRSSALLLAILFPITLLVIMFASIGLNLWLGKEFAEKSTIIMQLLVLGVLINAPAQVAFALIQAAGHSNWTARAHLIETPLYVLLLWACMQWWGITGAAIAWTVRISIDTLLMFFLSNKIYKNPIHGKMILVFIFTVIIYLLLILAQAILLKIIILVSSLVAFALFAFYQMLSEPDRQKIIGFLQNDN